jgi:hypothetical protein
MELLGRRLFAFRQQCLYTFDSRSGFNRSDGEFLPLLSAVFDTPDALACWGDQRQAITEIDRNDFQIGGGSFICRFG